MAWTAKDIPDLGGRVAAETQGGFAQRFFQGLASRTGMSAADGALPQLRAATDPTARGGQIYAPRFVNFGAAVRRPILRRIGLGKAIENLWEVSERETKLQLDVEAATAALGA